MKILVRVATMTVAVICILVAWQPPASAASCTPSLTCSVRLSGTWNYLSTGGVYQIYGTQKWTCLASVSGTNQRTMVSLSASNANTAVQFGIMTGNTPNATFYRQWFNYRSTPTFSQFNLISGAAPSRNTGYQTVVRYNGASWLFFVDNVQRGLFSNPSAGNVEIGVAEGSITHQSNAATGSITSLGWQHTPNTSPKAGWLENVDSMIAPFTANNSSVNYTSINFFNSAQTTGCP